MELREDTDLIRIDFESGKLVTLKRVYTIHQNLSVERYCEFQILEKELAYGSTFKTTFDKIKKALAQINAVKFVDAVITLTDLVRGMSKVAEREPTVLKICALFLNYEGENTAVYSKDVEDDKIKDWKEAGVDMRDFFTVALNTVPGFLELYTRISRSITAVLAEPEKQE